MKLAVLADIHANLAALQAVLEDLDAWRPDAVVVAGDVVNRGPRPAECLRLVQERQRTAGWLVVVGNHEEYVLWHTRPDAPKAGPAFEIFRSSYWTLQRLNGEVAALQAMPFQQTIQAPDGSAVRIVHASTRGTRDGIFPVTPDDVLRLQVGRPHVPLFIVGHTHVPLTRHLDGCLVVNVGAVGMPFDGDPRASYGRFTWQRGEWQAEIVRVAYDREETERDYVATGFLEGGGALTHLMLRELRLARSQLYQWSLRFEAAVLAGELSVDRSVQRFLES
ncbi:MAG: metallophosphoesterase family protein [Caldilineales bacterium]|nr:metallophosphoesterase family protein [Caldilineales bacterium]MDW8316988.1 metallophosphoesterase family protein [Anaerolineae bacterium]